MQILTYSSKLHITLWPEVFTVDTSGIRLVRCAISMPEQLKTEKLVDFAQSSR